MTIVKIQTPPLYFTKLEFLTQLEHLKHYKLSKVSQKKLSTKQCQVFERL
jgi:hypothetical protein